MRLLVTGGSGFLGEYVLRAAAAHGHEITALARSRAAAAKVGWLGAQPIRGDLADAGSLAAAFEAGRCEALINLASLGSGHAPAIIDAAKAAGIPRAVFLSTTAVTTTLPAASGPVRLAAEQEIRESGLDWTILRPTMIYGAAGDRNLSRLLVVLRRTPLLPVPAGAGLQQPVHVADVADAVLAAAERSGATGLTYDVAGPAPLSLAELPAHRGQGGGQPDPVHPGADAVGGGGDARLRAGQPSSPDPRRAATRAGRGQGLRHRRRGARPGLRAPVVR